MKSRINHNVFILSSERSGSNLLRTLIGNHSKAVAPNAPHFFNAVSPVFSYLEPLDYNRIEFSLDFLYSIVNHEYHGWDLTRLKPNEFIAKYEPKTIIDCFEGIYCEKMIMEKPASNLEELFCVYKENNLFDFFDQLKSHFLNAKFIYLYRDPRACVASWLKVPAGHTGIDNILRLWSREQLKCLEISESNPGSVLFVSYEALISNTQDTMEGVLNHIGVDIELKCFETSKSEKNSNWNVYLQNVNSPVNENKRNEYLKDLTPFQIDHIEKRTKEIMLKLGYSDFCGPKLIAEFNRNRSIFKKVFSKLGLRNKSNSKAKESEILTDKLLESKRMMNREFREKATKFLNPINK